MKRTYCPHCTATVKFPPQRENTKGKCPSCSKVFTLVAVGENLPSVSDAKPQTSIQPPIPLPQAENTVVSLVDTKHCSFCGELIAKSAIKCKHCGEFLDGRNNLPAKQEPTTLVVEEPRRPLRKSKAELERIRQEAISKSQAKQSPQPVAFQNTTVVNVTQVTAQAYPRWNRVLAGFLSFCFPGLGQLYKGQIIGGVLWAIFVIIGYAAFLVPGVCLHIICVLSAMSGDVYR